MHSKKFKRLLYKHLNNSLSDKEMSELLENLSNDRFQKSFSEVFDEVLHDNTFSGLTNPDSKAYYFRQLMNAIKEKESLTSSDDTSTETTGRRRISFPSWLAVAASLAILIVCGSLWIIHATGPGRKIEGVVAQSVVNDIEPGGNKAVLTLGDGSIIVLDSARNGLLATQSSTNVVKLEDGRLAYSSSSNKPAEVVYNTITTPRGGEYQIMLPDSSKVWLNSQSSIRFPVSFTGGERHVEITGEAYFEVVKYNKMSFTVSVNEMTIKVLGTRFNIRAYRDENVTETTLVEGSVQVARGEARAILNPGQQASLDSTGQISVVNNVDINQVLAWKNGLFLFNSADIVTIMNQISRWYNVDIDYEGDLPNELFSGIVSRNSNISKVLIILEQAGIKFTFEDDKIKVFY
ncbi:MAG: FecR domain-containing protein [Bacteroidales bacterium]